MRVATRRSAARSRNCRCGSPGDRVRNGSALSPSAASASPQGGLEPGRGRLATPRMPSATGRSAATAFSSPPQHVLGVDVQRLPCHLVGHARVAVAVAADPRPPGDDGRPTGRSGAGRPAAASASFRARGRGAGRGGRGDSSKTAVIVRTSSSGWSGRWRRSWAVRQRARSRCSATAALASGMLGRPSEGRPLLGLVRRSAPSVNDGADGEPRSGYAPTGGPHLQLIEPGCPSCSLTQACPSLGRSWRPATRRPQPARGSPPEEAQPGAASSSQGSPAGSRR